MKIYTKNGDTGKAQAPMGRLSKSDLVFEVFGSIDETQAAIGVVYELLPAEDTHKVELEKIMQALYAVSGSIYKMHDFDDDLMSKRLEEWIDKMDEELEVLNHFILPIGSTAGAQCHLARAISRRLERLFVRWREASNEEFKESLFENEYPNIGKFLNRLSDYLFTLARHITEKIDTTNKSSLK